MIDRKSEQVSFNTLSPYFEKEFEGLKNNTVRTISNEDFRKKILDLFANGDLIDLNIQITNPFNSAYFLRKIRDVTIYNDLYIITWYPVV